MKKYVIYIALILAGCGGSSTPPVTLNSIAITPDPAFIGAGTSLSLTATGTYSNTTTADLTSKVTWTSAPTGVVSVNSTGVITALASSGATTTITAAMSGVAGHVTVTISSGSSIHTTDLPTARYDHTATQLNDGLGTVLVAGGYDASGALDSAELYDLASKTFSLTGVLSTKRGDHGATLLNNGQVLVMGGVDGIGTASHDLTSSELYNPATNSWAATSSLITARSYHTVTLLNPVAPSTVSKVLVVGGGNQTTRFLKSAEIYDPALPGLTWAATGSLTTERDSHTATLLNDGSVLVVGGFDGTNALASAELYDPVAGTWSPTGSLSKGRYSHTATLLNDGTVLVVGGSDSAGNDLASAEIYHPTGANAGTWTSVGVSSLGTARYNHVAIYLPSTHQVMVIGGSNAGNTYLSSVELYTSTGIGTGTWSGAANLQTGRVVFSATLLSNTGPVLVVGGDGIRSDGTSGALSSVELLSY